MELMATTMDRILHRIRGWSLFMDEKNQINRKLANLLSAGRLYIDHLPHHINNMFGENSTQLRDINNEIKVRYDGNLGFRVMEAIRNYMLHRGFVIDSLTHNSSRDEATGFANNVVIPMIDITELEADSRFKRRVLQELKPYGDTADIRPFVRNYVASIGVIQEKVRNIIEKDTVYWEKTVRSMISKYPVSKEGKTDIVGLVVVCIKDSKWVPDSRVYLFLDFINRWKDLVSKCQLLGYLPKQVVTNVAKES